MSTVVTAHCGFCHTDLQLETTAVACFTYSTKHSADYYAFFCTGCREYNSKPADDNVVNLLMSGGVKVTLIDLPLEVIERESCTTPLVLDDVLNLVMYLRDNDVMPELEPARRKASRPQGAP